MEKGATARVAGKSGVDSSWNGLAVHFLQREHCASVFLTVLRPAGIQNFCLILTNVAAGPLCSSCRWQSMMMSGVNFECFGRK